jgi:Tfp pilus assembly protein PilP
MTRSLFHRPLIVAGACSLLALAACSQQQDQNAPSQADAAKAQAQVEANEANSQLQTYRQMLQIKNDEMASELGQEIVQHFPNSAAAKEVQQTLPDVQQRWKETSEKHRLAALWTYQVGPMEGGTQSTASLFSERPSGDRAVRLVLRRHTKWGQSVFMFGNGHGFVCKGNCVIQAQFDGKPHPLRAFLPTTGEPAIFIRDDKAFIDAMEKTKRITVDVEMQDGGKQELVFETGGYDPSKWTDLGKK